MSSLFPEAAQFIVIKMEDAEETMRCDGGRGRECEGGHLPCANDEDEGGVRICMRLKEGGGYQFVRVRRESSCEEPKRFYNEAYFDR